MSTIRPDFHTSLVNRTVEDIYYQRSNCFYFLGKIDSWGGEDDPPAAPAVTSEQDTIIRSNIAYLRKIAPSEVSLITTGYQWAAGTVFTQWDHTIEMQGKNFYCVTEDFNVYKCLDNSAGIPSTIKPSGTALIPFRTNDGYLWKYLYNIPPFKRSKFFTHGRIPIQRALSDTFYNRGAVETAVVLNSGSGYSDLQQTTITVDGPTTGSGATAKVTAVDDLGRITEIELTGPEFGGSGYTAGATVTVQSFVGTGADIAIQQTDGVITGFTINSSGFNYAVNDVVDISVGGAILVPVVAQDTGEIVRVEIEHPGAGYTSAPTLTVVQSPATGTGKYGNPTALVSAIIYQGSVAEVLIQDPGVDYPADTATTIVVAGDGTGAVFSPIIYNGQLIDVVVENPGSNYTYIDLEVVGSGSGAEILGIVGSSDFISDQFQVEQTAVRGAIYSVVVTNGGNNYSSETSLVFTGDGTGAAGYPVMESGVITKVVMTAYGTNYTYCNVEIVDPNRPVPNSYINAQAYAILPPISGHGYDAPRELYSDTLAIYTMLRDDRQLNLIQQDYRQYGLIKNPVDLLTKKRITTPTDYVVFKLELSSVGGLTVDDVLINNNKRYRIVTISENVVELIQLSSIYAQPADAFYKEGIPAVQYSIVRLISIPVVDKYSGQLLYVTNNTPFTPTDDLSIAIRTYIKL